jgi:hypothetical protein
MHWSPPVLLPNKAKPSAACSKAATPSTKLPQAKTRPLSPPGTATSGSPSASPNASSSISSTRGDHCFTHLAELERRQALRRQHPPVVDSTVTYSAKTENPGIGFVSQPTPNPALPALSRHRGRQKPVSPKCQTPECKPGIWLRSRIHRLRPAHSHARPHYPPPATPTTSSPTPSGRRAGKRSACR